MTLLNNPDSICYKDEPQSDIDDWVTQTHAVCRKKTLTLVYQKLFSWLVKALNLALREEVGEGGPAKGDGNDRSISLIDIFGFEVFRVNSYEQVCAT